MEGEGMEDEGPSSQSEPPHSEGMYSMHNLLSAICSPTSVCANQQGTMKIQTMVLTP